jgi:peroxiredoxin
MSRKEMSVYLVGLAVVIAVVIVIVVYNPSNPPSGPAPDFRLNDTEGSPFQLQSQHGHVVLLNLMDAKCSHCQLETRNVLVPLYSKYSANVMFISVDVQILGTDTDATLKDFKNSNGATWRYFLDTDSVVTKYAVHATPTAYIIDRNGNIFFHREGETDYNTFVSQLEAALKGP